MRRSIIASPRVSIYSLDAAIHGFKLGLWWAMRESHSLGTHAIAFTERPAYFNGLITHIETIKHSYYFKFISKLFGFGGPLTSAHMAHLLFNVLQPVPNLLYFWLMVGNQGI